MADRRSEGVKGPSGSQALTVVTLFPVGGLLLTLAGLTLTASVVGLAVATPVFILFSPVLVPAALAIGLAVLGFLASGGFGVAGLSALSCVANQLRGLLSKAPEQAEQARRRAAEAAAQVGQRAKELGQGIQSRAQEGK